MQPNREAEDDFKDYRRTGVAIFIIIIAAAAIGMASGPVAQAIFAPIAVVLELKESPRKWIHRLSLHLLVAIIAMSVSGLV